MTLALDLLWITFTAVCALVTMLSSLPGKSWVLRVCDFPRAQVLFVACVLLVTELARYQAGGQWSDSVLSDARPYLLVMLAVTICIQLWWALRLTPLARKELRSANEPASEGSLPTSQGSDGKDRIRLISANVDYTNEARDQALSQLIEHGADVIALIEPDARWDSCIMAQTEEFPYVIKELRERGRGMALLSRFPILQEDVLYLVDEDRPSIWCQIVLPNNSHVRIVVTHPPPPGLPKRSGDGRHSSRKRDIELDIIASRIREKPNQHWILTGDFNDVGWSATTLRAKRVSALLDPRIGRGMYNTFPASWPFVRYPIDHVLVSPSFRLIQLSRLEHIGSDHLPLGVELTLDDQEPRSS